MRDTYLVQRLEAPAKSDHAYEIGKVFGGAMLQLNDQTWDVLKPLFTFHYMGAAEYEFGTIPRVLFEMSQDADKLVTGSFVLPGSAIKPSYIKQGRIDDLRRKELLAAKAAGIKPKRAKKSPELLPKPRTIYTLCREEHLNGVREVIGQLALDKLHTKNGNAVARTLDPADDYDKATLGWLELDNGFFFFVDEGMWNRTTALFKLFRSSAVASG